MKKSSALPLEKVKKKAHIFDGQQASIQEGIRFFKENFALVRHRAKPGLKECMSQWIDTLQFIFFSTPVACTICKCPHIL
jgi:hypothetical protein